ncbi:putative ribonuclease H-like domain-containing protein [Tanacetum coccineum]
MSDSEDSTVTYTEVPAHMRICQISYHRESYGPLVMPDGPYAYGGGRFIRAPSSPETMCPGPEDPEHGRPQHGGTTSTCPIFKFKKREMNQFCEMKGILRQYNVARTPQQNGVVERRNMTLIEAAKTMLPFNSNGPDSLFDIDALTRTMNYEPIVAGTQSNGFAGTKASDNAGQARKETEPVKNYILLPLWTADPPYSQDPKSSQNDGSKPLINAIGGKTSIKLPFDLNMPALEDYSIFDDEDDGAEADMNNLDTTIQVSPIPTTRIHKDHPLDQVIGDLQSATQTRKMSKNLEEHGFVRRTQKGNSCIEGSKLDRGYAGRASTIQVTRKFCGYAKGCKNAFIYGKIEKEVYVCQPPGFEDPDFPNRVYKVKKALYGLHQAPRAWYETLSTYLLDNEFQRGKIDKTLFIKRHKVYVDDIIFGSTKKELWNAFEKLMHEKFQMSSMGELTLFLGLQVEQKKDDIFIMCACARYQVNPKVSHLHAVKRIFRYLKGQPKLGLWYPKDSPFDLVAYTDSDYAGASLDRKSTTGGCQFLGCRLISWQCKKQTVVANSTTEAEYVAASSCCGQVLWIQNQLLDYGYLQLEAEQDGVNIEKTQSKATPNEVGS